MTKVEQIMDFREVFSIPTPTEPKLFDKEKALQMIEHIRSELVEMEEAIEAEDLAGVLDAIIDADYFLHQQICNYGLQGVYPEAFDRVHDANMAKPCDTEGHALRTKNDYLIKGIDTWIDYNEKADKYLVKRLSDNKCLKASGWQEPNFDDLV